MKIMITELHLKWKRDMENEWLNTRNKTQKSLNYYRLMFDIVFQFCLANLLQYKLREVIQSDLSVVTFYPNYTTLFWVDTQGKLCLNAFSKIQYLIFALCLWNYWYTLFVPAQLTNALMKCMSAVNRLIYTTEVATHLLYYTLFIKMKYKFTLVFAFWILLASVSDFQKRPCNRTS